MLLAAVGKPESDCTHHGTTYGLKSAGAAFRALLAETLHDIE